MSILTIWFSSPPLSVGRAPQALQGTRRGHLRTRSAVISGFIAGWSAFGQQEERANGTERFMARDGRHHRSTSPHYQSARTHCPYPLARRGAASRRCYRLQLTVSYPDKQPPLTVESGADLHRGN